MSSPRVRPQAQESVLPIRQQPLITGSPETNSPDQNCDKPKQTQPPGNEPTKRRALPDSATKPEIVLPSIQALSTQKRQRQSRTGSDCSGKVAPKRARSYRSFDTPSPLPTEEVHDQEDTIRVAYWAKRGFWPPQGLDKSGLKQELAKTKSASHSLGRLELSSGTISLPDDQSQQVVSAE